ncbi:Rmf/CrpP fold protein [Streptomyces sp. NPDC050597]|uniref:Rmf/CrpP fold protein n=1 Tax=Streptomyces sp. NPDC050597 TaxID=3157212 RepID=UPI003424A8BE
MGTREDIARAIIEGRTAGEAGEEPRACPYPHTSILRTAWVKGYASGRRAFDREPTAE